MKTKILLISLIFSILFCQDKTVYLVPIHGDIDMGLPYFIERAVLAAESNNVSN